MLLALFLNFMDLLTRLQGWRNPKDLGFYAFSQFGPSKRLPEVARVKRFLPKTPDSTIGEWLVDYHKVDKKIWELSEKGVPHFVAALRVKKELKASFPFLTGPGLKQAVFLVRYFAWHEGH
jgi:hypothetical protein